MTDPMNPADVPQQLVDAATFAFAARSVATGDATDFTAYVRGMLAAVLPLHGRQLTFERDEWHRQNGVLRGELAAATARAEQAKARLAEIGDVREEWNVGSEDGYPNYIRTLSEAEARDIAGRDALALLHRFVGDWRKTDNPAATGMREAEV